MLKAIHTQESKKAAREKAKAVVEQLLSMKLKEAAKKVENGIEETLTYCDFPSEHWTRIRTNNVIERLNREIRRRTRVVVSFPDGNSALMLVCARLRHVAGTQWGNKKYMNMKHLEAAVEDASIAGCLHSVQSLQTNLRKILDTTRPGHGQSHGAGAVRNAVRAERKHSALGTSLPVRCVFSPMWATMWSWQKIRHQRPPVLVPIPRGRGKSSAPRFYINEQFCQTGKSFSWSSLHVPATLYHNAC